MTPPITRISPQSPPLSQPLLLFLFGRMGSSIAFQMLGVAVGWQMYAITSSAWYLGLVGLAQFLPMVLLTLLAGQVADRYDRRTIARTCQFVEAMAAVALAVGGYYNLLGKEVLLAIMVVIGSARAFEYPTMHALVPRLVPREQLPRALALSASANQTATIVGPAIGGILYAAGVTTVYSTIGVLFLAACILISCIRPASETTRPEAVTDRSLFAGISFIKQHPVVLGAISLDLFAVLLGGATALLPIYARDILITGPWGLGLLRSAPAIGALAMSLWLARRPLKRRVGRTMFRSVALFGVATLVFAVSQEFWLSMAALVVLGAADVISVVIRSSLVQMETPDEMRGRVSAVNSLFIGTSNQLGEFESGATAALFGTVPSVLIGGIGTLLVVALWIRLFPQLAQVDTLGKK